VFYGCFITVANKVLNDLYEVGRACSVYGEGRGAYGVLWGNLRKTDHLEDSGVDVRVILKYIFNKLYRGVDWIDLV
jgi:hypothetical protein